MVEAKRPGWKISLKGEDEDFCLGHIEIEVPLVHPNWKHWSEAQKWGLERNIDFGIKIPTSNVQIKPRWATAELWRAPELVPGAL